jgi:hypothetical protein
MTKAQPNNEVFRVSFTDRKNRNFRREYLPHCQDEKTAKQWAEKQRDSWNHHYDYGGKGSELLTDPRTWIVRVSPENSPQPKIG